MYLRCRGGLEPFYASSASIPFVLFLKSAGWISTEMLFIGARDEIRQSRKEEVCVGRGRVCVGRRRVCLGRRSDTADSEDD